MEKGKHDVNSNVELGTEEKEEESDKNSLDAAIAKQFASGEVSSRYKVLAYFVFWVDIELWEEHVSNIHTHLFDTQQDTGCKLYLKITAKLLGMVCMFYFFVISLDLMGTGFQLATGKVASSLFADSELFNNPFFALMVGVLVQNLQMIFYFLGWNNLCMFYA